ncbi:MAG: 4-hydroxy-tetrahydrodipicolinate reductase [Candidatus Eisenbacteria bacterium]
MIRLCVAGATGKVGRGLVAAIARAEDLTLASAVARNAVEQSLYALLGIAAKESGAPDVTIDSDIATALAKGVDVLVDYTHPSAVRAHVEAAIARRVHVVVGTSGLSDRDYEEIDAKARAAGVGVLAAGNFAITAVLAQQFALLAARLLPTWEVIDYASDQKPDAPSGTARELAFRLAQVGKSQPAVPVAETKGERTARGAELGGTQVHSLRVPGFYSGIEVLLGRTGERLSIRHDALGGVEPYVEGTLLAARRVASFVGLRRGLDQVLDLGR